LTPVPIILYKIGTSNYHERERDVKGSRKELNLLGKLSLCWNN